MRRLQKTDEIDIVDVFQWVQWVSHAPSAKEEEMWRAGARGQMLGWAKEAAMEYISRYSISPVRTPCHVSSTLAFLHACAPFTLADRWWTDGER